MNDYFFDRKMAASVKQTNHDINRDRTSFIMGADWARNDFVENDLVPLVKACQALLENYEQEKAKAEEARFHVITLDFRALIDIYDALNDLNKFMEHAPTTVGDKDE